MGFRDENRVLAIQTMQITILIQNGKNNALRTPQLGVLHLVRDCEMNTHEGRKLDPRWLETRLLVEGSSTKLSGVAGKSCSLEDG